MAFALALIAGGICTILRQGALNTISSEKWVTNLAGGSGIGAGILLFYFSYTQKNKDSLMEFIKEKWLKPSALQWQQMTHMNGRAIADSLIEPARLQEMAEKIAKVVERMPPCSMLIIKGYSPDEDGVDFVDRHIIRAQDGSWTLTTVSTLEARFILGSSIPECLNNITQDCFSFEHWQDRGGQEAMKVPNLLAFRDTIVRQAEEQFTVKPDCENKGGYCPIGKNEDEQDADLLAHHNAHYDHNS